MKNEVSIWTKYRSLVTKYLLEGVGWGLGRLSPHRAFKTTVLHIKFEDRQFLHHAARFSVNDKMEKLHFRFHVCQPFHATERVRPIPSAVRKRNKSGSRAMHTVRSRRDLHEVVRRRLQPEIPHCCVGTAEYRSRHLISTRMF